MSATDHFPTRAPMAIATCPDCDGSGVIVSRVTVYEAGCGFPHDDSNERPCPTCDGLGSVAQECSGDRSCPVCNGDCSDANPPVMNCSMAFSAPPKRDRPATNPGGCECLRCGAIFIGEEWHDECAVCAGKSPAA